MCCGLNWSGERSDWIAAGHVVVRLRPFSVAAPRPGSRGCDVIDCHVFILAGNAGNAGIAGNVNQLIKDFFFSILSILPYINQRPSIFQLL